MCGIIGYIGRDNAVDVVVEGLRHLEYRGYDSAGVAFLNDDHFEVRRCKGKIKELEGQLFLERPYSNLAIGHTRWATHGVPSEYNAHPHSSENVVIVHNGIIENYLEIKEDLIEKGYGFSSETDSEVISHLIDSYHKKCAFEEAVRSAFKKLRGSYAVVVVSRKEPEKLIGVRKDSPLVLGIGGDEFFLASDVPAFIMKTRDVIFLDDNNMAVIQKGGYMITDFDGRVLEKNRQFIPWSPSMADRGGYKHYMIKEIHEQPRTIADTLRGRIFPERNEVNFEEFGLGESDLKRIRKIHIGACGTSWHAALVGKYMIERIAKIPVEVDYASEFRYRDPVINDGDLFLAITQSGETADTLYAQREAKRRGALTLSICNVLGSTSAREADAVFYTHSGPEIGVASTKSFTSQLVSLSLLLSMLGKVHDAVKDESTIISELLSIPEKVEDILRTENVISDIAREFFKAKDFLYLGRGILYPIALEGALKLKEISYIHAEGYPAGEMKHGPIALIDEDFPVVVLMPKGELKEKIIANIAEVKARGGRVIVVKGNEESEHLEDVDYAITIPETNQYLTPILMVIPLQLLAYHIGVLRGCDVDQPRNLAKSVTVE
jgi:glucosamine--fructose-6-phosphate aminotransferase (isomerizing)